MSKPFDLRKFNLKLKDYPEYGGIKLKTTNYIRAIEKRIGQRIVVCLTSANNKEFLLGKTKDKLYVFLLAERNSPQESWNLYYDGR
jgi:hypothetical protein